MKAGDSLISHLECSVSKAMGHALARIKRLCSRMILHGFRISLIPGVLTCDISFRAGGSGRAYFFN